jgi:CheY-like chemotaxis protein
MRILIIDDHADSAEMLSVILTRKGHAVRTAASCAQAMTLCAAESFDLLISDLGLPVCDGWETLQRLRQTCTVPAIALSGHARAASIEQSRAAGFDAHLTKPVDFAVLTETIDRLTGGRAAPAPAAANADAEAGASTS